MKITVTWFNSLKGFGEAKTADGRIAFLHYTAISPNPVSLKPNEPLQARLRMYAGTLIVYSATRKGKTK